MLAFIVAFLIEMVKKKKNKNKSSICWDWCFRLCTYEEFLRLENPDLEPVSALTCRCFLSSAARVRRGTNSEAAHLIPDCRMWSAAGS